MIPTYVTAGETAALVELARGRVVLELGTQYGHSALAMAESAELVVTVDWHWGDKDAGWRDTLSAFVANLRGHPQQSRVIPVVGNIGDVLPLLRPLSFDLLFLDAGHDRVSVARDLGYALPLLRSPWSVAAHDWGLFEVSPTAGYLLGPPDRVVERLAIWSAKRGR